MYTSYYNEEKTPPIPNINESVDSSKKDEISKGRQTNSDSDNEPSPTSESSDEFVDSSNPKPSTSVSSSSNGGENRVVAEEEAKKKKKQHGGTAEHDSADNDDTGPVISSISSGTPTTTSATITWITNEKADSQVDYGTTVAYGLSSPLYKASYYNHSITISGLDSGQTYHYRVRSQDDSEERTYSGDQSFTTDTSGGDVTVPVLAEVTPVTTPANDTTPNYTFSSTEAGTISYGGSCTSATTSATSGNNTITFSTLSASTYSNCTVTVTDASSNASSTLSITAFTIDTTAPVLTEVTPVTTPTSDTTPSYTFSSSEVGTISYGGSCASATTSASSGNNTITLNALGDGTYSNCTVTVTDASSNASSALSMTAFTVDTGASILAEVTPVSTPASDTTPNYTFSSTEAGTISYGGSCSSATTSASSGNNTITFSALSGGTYSNCTVTVTDASSNVSSALAVTAFTIDTTAPVVAEVTPVTTPTSDTTPNYIFSSSEAGTISYGGSCTSATTSASSGSNTITFSTLSAGTYSNCTVTVTDSASNASNVLSVTAFTIDVTAPTLAEITPVTTPTGDTTPSYTFSSTEAGTISYGGSCSSATTSASSGNNTITFTTLSSGTYSNCTVTVTDTSSNASNALAVTAFTIDTTIPTLAEVTPVTTPTNDTTPNYTFSSSEAGTISYGGSCASATTSASSGNNTITFSTLSAGAYSNCTVTVTDASLNASSALAVTAFTVDTTNPTVSVTAPTEGEVVSGTAYAITANASDNIAVAGVQFKVDGSNQGAEDTVSAYSTTWNTTLVSDGSHTVTAVARDTATNTATATTITVTVDNTGPVLSSISSGTPASTTATITWTTNENGDSQIDYGTTGSYGSSTTLNTTQTTSHSEGLTGLSPSTLYHYRVRSADAEGNITYSTDQTFTTAAASVSTNYSVIQASFLDSTSGVGATFYEQTRDMEYDSSGNLYIAGGTPGSDFPTLNAYDSTFNSGGGGTGAFGPMDNFVMKVGSDGELIWSTYFGGPNYDRAYALELGPDGSVYIAGRAGDGLPTTSGVLQTTFSGDTSDGSSSYGDQDGFIARFDSDGALLWSTYVGETGPGFIRDIDVDSSGNVHVAYTNLSASLGSYITGDAIDSTVTGAGDAAYLVISSNGQSQLYGTYIGGTDGGSKDGITPSIRLSASDEAYFYTSTNADDFITTVGAYDTTRAGGYDYALMKFNADYSLDWSTLLGGTGDEELETHQLALDASGNAYVTGLTKSTNYPTTSGVYQTASGGGTSDIGIAKISADGTTLLAATYLGGSGRDEGEGITYNTATNEVVLTGNTASSNFPTTASALDSTLSGTNDSIVVKFNSTLTTLNYSTLYGNTSEDTNRCIAISSSGLLATGGQTGSINYPLVNSISASLRGTFAASLLVLQPQ